MSDGTHSSKLSIPRGSSSIASILFSKSPEDSFWSRGVTPSSHGSIEGQVLVSFSESFAYGLLPRALCKQLVSHFFRRKSKLNAVVRGKDSEWSDQGREVREKSWIHLSTC